MSDGQLNILSGEFVWKKMQNFSKNYWDEFSKYNVEKNKQSFYQLIKKSIPEENCDFQITARLVYGIDLDIYFNCNNTTKSTLWVAESMNWVPNVFRFLEAIIDSQKTEKFFYCDEEGKDSFLYVQTINDTQIRFIHLSDTIYIDKNKSKNDDFNIRQDLIINKKEFVKHFYSAINEAVNLVKIEELNAEGRTDLLNDFETLKKGSNIIEKYLIA